MEFIAVTGDERLDRAIEGRLFDQHKVSPFSHRVNSVDQRAPVVLSRIIILESAFYCQR